MSSCGAVGAGYKMRAFRRFRRDRSDIVGQLAERVYTQTEDVRHLELLVDELAINARVSLHLLDGKIVEGVVAVTPTVQVFRDPQGQEGINGMVKLIDVKRPDWSESVWLSDIMRLEHLDSVTKGSSKA
jgi:hypothetical protein